MEKFNYYFNTRKKIDDALNVTIDKSNINSVLFHLIWDLYYNVSTEEDIIVNRIESWMKKRTNIFHLATYGKTIKSYIKTMKDMPWRNIQTTIKIRDSELKYITSFNDIKKEKLLFCYLAIAKFADASRKTPSHWESEDDKVVFKMARVHIPASERDYFIHRLIVEDPRAKIYLNYKNDDTSKRIDYISDDENDPVILELDEDSYYELAFTYLNWRNGGGYKKCHGCGRLFKVKTKGLNVSDTSEILSGNRTIYCKECSTKYEPKYKGKNDMAIDYKPRKTVCDDCGKEIYLESYKDTETCRCAECREIHLKKLKSEQNRRYYQSKKQIQ